MQRAWRSSRMASSSPSEAPSPPGTFAVSRFLGGTCGDGQLDGGEECDDGNLTAGGGCDQNCCLSDGDGDGLCDSLDPCTGTPPAASNPKLRASTSANGIDTPGKLTLSGEVVLPHPFTPPLDPVA